MNFQIIRQFGKLCQDQAQFRKFSENLFCGRVRGRKETKLIFAACLFPFFHFRVMSYSFYVYIRFMLSHCFIRFMSYISVVVGPDLSISLLYRLFDDLRRFISFMVYLSPNLVYTPSCVK